MWQSHHSQQRKTRAWGGIRSVDVATRLHATIYWQCCVAMLSLDAGEGIMNIYKPLSTGDLHSSMVLINPACPGQHNKNLPWFWSFNVGSDSNSGKWMHECKCHIAAIIIVLFMLMHI